MHSIRCLVAGLAVAGSLALVPVENANACVGCRTAGEIVKEKESQTVKVGYALSWSVLFLLGTVGGLGGFMGIYMKKAIARVDDGHEGL